MLNKVIDSNLSYWKNKKWYLKDVKYIIKDNNYYYIIIKNNNIVIKSKKKKRNKALKVFILKNQIIINF